MDDDRVADGIELSTARNPLRTLGKEGSCARLVPRQYRGLGNDDRLPTALSGLIFILRDSTKRCLGNVNRPTERPGRRGIRGPDRWKLAGAWVLYRAKTGPPRWDQG